MGEAARAERRDGKRKKEVKDTREGGNSINFPAIITFPEK